MLRTLATVVYAVFFFLAVGLWTAVLIQSVQGASWHAAALAWTTALGPTLAIVGAAWLGFRGVRHTQ